MEAGWRCCDDCTGTRGPHSEHCDVREVWWRQKDVEFPPQAEETDSEEECVTYVLPTGDSTDNSPGTSDDTPEGRHMNFVRDCLRFLYRSAAGLEGRMRNMEERGAVLQLLPL